jgi:hypothetical protein
VGDEPAPVVGAQPELVAARRAEQDVGEVVRAAEEPVVAVLAAGRVQAVVPEQGVVAGPAPDVVAAAEQPAVAGVPIDAAILAADRDLEVFSLRRRGPPEPLTAPRAARKVDKSSESLPTDA